MFTHRSLLSGLLSSGITGLVCPEYSDALINEIDLHKKENDLSKIVGDIAYLQRLVDKLNSQEFKEKDLYDKAKHGVFQLLKAGDKVEQIVKKTIINDKEETSLILSLK